MHLTPPNFRNAENCSNCANKGIVDETEELNNGHKTITFTHALKCKRYGFVIHHADKHTCDDWEGIPDE